MGFLSPQVSPYLHKNFRRQLTSYITFLRKNRMFWTIIYFYYSLYLDVEAKKRSKSRKSEYNPPSKMVTIDKGSMKNQFKIIQKLLGNIFDKKDIIFHHSDHLKAKVGCGVPVQVIRMVQLLIYYRIESILSSYNHSDDLNGYTPFHFCFQLVGMMKYDISVVKNFS